MTKIETFFETLKNEGLYDARLVVAGKEYCLPGKTGDSNKALREPQSKLKRILKYAWLLIPPAIIAFVLLSMLPEHSRVSKKNDPGIARLTDATGANRPGQQTAAPGKESKGTPIQTWKLAGIRFYEVANNKYFFKYISEKVFLHKLKSPGSDIRLTLNDTIDKINKQANKIKWQASVLTPRFMLNEHLLELWQDDCLAKWQILTIGKGEALLVTNITPDTVSTTAISGWETLSGNKNVFTRIVLKKIKD